MRRLLLALAAAALAWAAFVFVTGGIEWHLGSFSLRSRDPSRALFAAGVLVLAQGLLYRSAFAHDAARLRRSRRLPRLVAAAAVVAAAAHAWHFGSFIATGSDAYGYVSQAYGWRTGALPAPYALKLPLSEPDALQTPLGHREGPRPHTMVPTYAPGLPLLMALGMLVLGDLGAWVVVPASAAAFVWFTFLLGRRAAGPAAGAIAAVLAASSPVFLFQSLWPMSDVPAGAAWTGAMAAALGGSRRSAALSGAATALGVLVRPNLLPLAAVPLCAVLLQADGITAAADGSPLPVRRRPTRLIRAILFCLPVIAVIWWVAALNAAWYGSPLRSGYGTASTIFSIGYLWPNLQRYPAWMWSSQSALVLLPGLSLLALRSRNALRRSVALLWIFCTGGLLLYLVYMPFEEWWYLRFLLPVLGGFFVLTAIGLLAAARWVHAPFDLVAVAILLLLSVSYTISFSWAHGVFGPLKRSEHRYADVGEFASRTLPPNAVVLAMQHSGTMRFYGGRVTVRYDFVHPGEQDDLLAEIQRLGLHPFLAIDDWEAPEVQKAFGLPLGRPLPWPVVGRMRESGGVTIYDLRESGGGAPTEVAGEIRPGLAPRYSAPKAIVLQPLSGASPAPPPRR